MAHTTAAAMVSDPAKITFCHVQTHEKYIIRNFDK